MPTHLSLWRNVQASQFPPPPDWRASDSQWLSRPESVTFEADALKMVQAIAAHNFTGLNVLNHLAQQVGWTVIITPGALNSLQAKTVFDPRSTDKVITIQYMPSHYSPLAGRPADPGMAADEVLLHELVHALRIASKTYNVSDAHGLEEFVAMTVTNVYSSERRRPLRDPRKDFYDQTKLIPLQGASATSAGFLKVREYLLQTDRFFKSAAAREFVKYILWDEITFNPLREYLKHEAMYESEVKLLTPQLEWHGDEEIEDLLKRSQTFDHYPDLAERFLAMHPNAVRRLLRTQPHLRNKLV